MKRPDDAAIESAYDAGTILRTHVLRPTWHFVLPADIRWLLELTAPRVRALTRYYDRQLGIDAELLQRSHAAISGMLRGGKHLTRTEIARELPIAPASKQRLANLLMHAELDALICSGPRRGKQFTYALLSERAPVTKAPKSRANALAELTLRYFQSHGPALPQDFAWWSGLTIADAKAGIAAVGSKLAQLEVAGRVYWHSGDPKPPRLRNPTVHMLPNYDEHLVAYKDRSAAFDRERLGQGKQGPRDSVIFNHVVTLNGQVIGGWRRPQNAAKTETTLLPRVSLAAPEKAALKKAQTSLAGFLKRSTHA
jgi:hypothetical protein